MASQVPPWSGLTPSLCLPAPATTHHPSTPCPSPGIPLCCSCSSAKAQGKSKPWAWSHEDCSPASPASRGARFPAPVPAAGAIATGCPECPQLPSPAARVLPALGWDCRLCSPVVPVWPLGWAWTPKPLEDTLACWSVTDCLLPACCRPSSAGLNVSTSEEGGLGLIGDREGHVCSLPSAPAQGSRVQAQPAPGKASAAFGPGCSPGSLSP